MAKKAARSLALALGCAEYEMHVLAAGLLMRQENAGAPSEFADAVSEVIATALLEKGRSLVEFLLGSQDDRRITVESFGIPPRNNRDLGLFLGFVSQHSVHLDWNRAQDPLRLRNSKYDDALGILRECAFV